MPRPQRPLDSAAGPVQAFAAELRKLRTQAGDPKYLQMARKTGKSRTALTEAAGGDHLPTWETVAAFVTACGADPADWRVRWEQTRDLVRAIAPAGPGESTSGDSFSPVPSDGTQPDVVAGRRRRFRRSASYALAILAGALVGSVITVIVTTGSESPPPHQTTPVALHTSGPMVITVQNKVALGAAQLIEDTTPAYLSTKPVPYCTRLGCRMLGTEWVAAPCWSPFAMSPAPRCSTTTWTHLSPRLTRTGPIQRSGTRRFGRTAALAISLRFTLRPATGVGEGCRCAIESTQAVRAWLEMAMKWQRPRSSEACWRTVKVVGE